ncbi:hypothetical protein ACKFKF_33705 [Phormidesmis sp. 146-12]
MIEQISLLLATPIVKAVLDKFYEGVGSKLEEKAVELLPEKVKQLGQTVWEKLLRGQPGTGELLEKAANGSTEDQEKLTQYLHEALESDVALKQEAQKLAEEIHLQINNDFGQMTQINRDNSIGYQTRTGANSTNFFGGTHNHG